MPSDKPQFVHLRAHSAYSLLEGAIKIPDLIWLCKEDGQPAVAMTDNNNLFGSLEFSQAAIKEKLQPIIGSVVTVSDGTHKGPMVLIAKNDEGYKNLLALVSDAYLKYIDQGKPVIPFEAVKDAAKGIIALTGGHEGILGQYLLHGDAKGAEQFLQSLKTTFPDHLYIELMRHGLEEQQRTETGFIELAMKYDIPLVATNDAYFATKDMHRAHDVLICIADGRYISEENRRHFTRNHYFKSQAEMVELFKDVPEAIQNTLNIAHRCSVMSETHEPLLPSFDTAEGRDEYAEFDAVARAGLQERLEEHVFPEGASDSEKEDIAKPYIERLDFELEVIKGMKFPGYFLIVSDFIRWAKEQKIPVGPGRGSGAGSVVAWAMMITDLDPLRFGLLFERFLNPERISMPDFDIDFCQERRDEVIAYVQRKYGHDRVAQIITFGKLQARAVLRDVGRVLQMSYGQVDRICKLIPFNPLQPVTLSQAIEMDDDLQKARDEDEQVATLLDIGLKLEGLFRHASTHAAGVVISDRPLTELIPLYHDQRSEMPVTQYSMKYSEAAGLVKFDFLGLKTLTVIDQACRLVKEHTPDFDIQHIPFDDRPTFDMLSNGQTTGVFQMESAGMRDALRKLRPDTIEDIIALISLYRPGPMENIPTYVARKHGREVPDYMHPKLEPILKETFGVMIYQEQVMQIAQVLAGYSLGGADLLRRAMGKKIKEEMDTQRELFVNGAIAQMVNKKTASDIFDKVAKFAGYGFNKSHAAAYAVIGYQTAYLKANYPVEFLVASMNIDIGDTEKLNVFRGAAQRANIMILPPDVNASNALFSVELTTNEEGEEVKAVRYGLGALKSVGVVAMKAMQDERTENGQFTSVFDMAKRCDSKIFNKRQIESLAKAGAFDSVFTNRRQLFESAPMLVRYNQDMQRDKASNQTGLFDGFAETDVAAPLPALPEIEDWDTDTKLNLEFEAIGFYLNAHPLDHFMDELQRNNIVSFGTIDDLLEDGSTSILVAGTITKVIHRAANGKRFAYLQLSDPTGAAEISVFDEHLIANNRDLLEGNEPIVVGVDARKDEGGVRLMASSLTSLRSYMLRKSYKLNIEIDSDAELLAIKQLLDGYENGNAEVLFFIRTANNVGVTIRLPQTYLLNDTTKTTLKELQGIRAVNEQ